MFIDDHVGVSIAGLASDGRILWYETLDSSSVMRSSL